MQLPIRLFRQTITLARPWVVIAVALTVVLFLYFAAQGVRYWQANGDVSSARDEIERLEQVAGRETLGTTEQEAQLTAKRIRLENLHSLFNYPTTDTLMSIVSETAREAGLVLASMTVENVQIQALDTLQYYVQPITVSIDGPTADVREFLAALYDRAPVVVASDAKMANLDTDPTTQLQLRFYLSPEPIPEDSEETAG